MLAAGIFISTPTCGIQVSSYELMYDASILESVDVCVVAVVVAVFVLVVCCVCVYVFLPANKV